MAIGLPLESLGIDGKSPYRERQFGWFGVVLGLRMSHYDLFDFSLTVLNLGERAASL
jgi:hypothetical protein